MNSHVFWDTLYITQSNQLNRILLKSLLFVCILVFVFKSTDKLFHPSNLFIFSSFACLFSFLHFSTFLLFIFYVSVSFKPISYSLSNKLFGLFIFYSLTKFYFSIYSLTWSWKDYGWVLSEEERIMNEWMNDWIYLEGWTWAWNPGFIVYTMICKRCIRTVEEPHI